MAKTKEPDTPANLYAELVVALQRWADATVGKDQWTTVEVVVIPDAGPELVTVYPPR